mmetsp:Transcript_17302/g.50297  ORF Transcript_17302/g.50297 Transcript_17302/m.50297 type:complete len:266 (+) Transcript_17302:453-1250(+)
MMWGTRYVRRRRSGWWPECRRRPRALPGPAQTPSPRLPKIRARTDEKTRGRAEASSPAGAVARAGAEVEAAGAEAEAAVETLVGRRGASGTSFGRPRTWSVLVDGARRLLFSAGSWTTLTPATRTPTSRSRDWRRGGRADGVRQRRARRRRRAPMPPPMTMMIRRPLMPPAPPSRGAFPSALTRYTFGRRGPSMSKAGETTSGLASCLSELSSWVRPTRMCVMRMALWNCDWGTRIERGHCGRGRWARMRVKAATMGQGSESHLP